MLKQAMRARRRSEAGFTLVELLVVIVILGILAAVVVFAVGGITDKGQTSACAADKASIETAEEANFAAKGSYADFATLVTNKFIHDTPTLHSVTITGPGPVTGDTYVVSACTK